MPEVLQELPGISPDLLARLLLSLLTVVGVWGIRRVGLGFLQRRAEDSRSIYHWSKASAYFAFALVLIALVLIWLEGIRALGTFLGLLSAGLAIALRDLVTALAGWVFILARRPFEVGDRIQVGPHAGDVVDIRVFQFSILEVGNWVSADQSTGRLIHLPNHQVFSTPIANYTSDFPYLWNELPVTVTFESDWKKAKEILGAVAAAVVGEASRDAEASLLRASRRLMIHYRALSPTVYTSVRDHGVALTIRYLCAPRTRRGTAQALWEEILERFSREPDIDFAYPTQRILASMAVDPEAESGGSTGGHGPAASR